MSLTKEEWISQVLAERKKQCWTYQSGKEVFVAHVARVDFKCTNKVLWTIHDPQNGREYSVHKLVTEAFSKCNKKPDFEFVVSVDDVPRTNFNKPWFCFCTNETQTANKDFSTTVPDYAFDCLHLKGRYGFLGTGRDDFEGLVEEIIEAGKTTPQTNKLGWIGHPGVHAREHLLEKGKTEELKDLCDFISMTWYEDPNNKTWPSKFMSFSDQIKKWRFILDIQGNVGWTDRLKYYFFSNRVLFLVDRVHYEYYFKDLIPWHHYVPVDGWQTNLKENILKVLNDPVLEENLRKNAFEFATKNLTRTHAVNFYKNLIENTEWDKQTYNIIHSNEPKTLPSCSEFNEFF